MYLMCVFGTVILTVYAQVIIKARAIFHAAEADRGDQISYILAMLLDPWVISGFAAALLGSLFWMIAMQKLELSFAYPFIALIFVLVPIASYFIFHEGFNAFRIAGIALIVAGITVSALAA